MNMRPPPDAGPWLPVEEAKSRGMVCSLVEDMLDGETDPPLHRTTARATEAALVMIADRPLPGIVLADGSVLALSWQQSVALVAALTEFRRVVVPVERDAHGPARACVALPT